MSLWTINGFVFFTSLIVINSFNRKNQHTKLSGAAFLEENCLCVNQWQCECCAKINNDIVNIHNTLCADWKVFTKSWDILTHVRLNGNILYTYTFSTSSIPPFCVPIMPTLALTGCIQIHSIKQHNFNTLHGCTNITLNFITMELINQSLGCLDISPNGIQGVDANHDIVPLPLTEKPPEIELITIDMIGNHSALDIQEESIS